MLIILFLIYEFDWSSYSSFLAIFGYSTACIKLEEFQTAKAALEKGASLAPGDARFTDLIKECDQCIAGW